MSWGTRSRFICLLGLILICLGGVPGSDQVFAAAALPDSTATVPASDHRSWLGGLFDRYLRAKPHPDEGLKGQAQETIARYLPFTGWIIEVVLINQVAVFDEDWNARRDFGARLVNRLTNPLQSNTREGTIRRQFLFRRGQPLDPFALADTELLLRSLPFIDDVRIMVIPLAGEQQKVALVVETRDSWPLGVDAKVINQGRYDLSVYTANLLGYGLAMSHELVHKADADPAWGYHAHVRQPNLTGHFIDLDLDYENSWRRLSGKILLEKKLVHPAVRLVGGGRLEVLDDRNNGDIPRRFTAEDFWLGRALRLGNADPRQDTARLLMVPVVGYRGVSFQARPAVSLTENRGYHDSRLLLTGLSLLRVRDYKTTHFYRMGETEDIRAGWKAQLIAGYEDGEFQKRSGAWLTAGLVTVGPQGSVRTLRLGCGGYWRHGDFEEGVEDLSILLATRLYGLGNFGQRWFARVRYTRGINRFPEENLSLGNSTGLRGVDDDVLLGRQRLSAGLETRLFTPWTLWGFRCLMLGYLDAGVIADEHDALLRRRIMLSMGVGMRLDNPGLVLPPLQIRVGVRDRALGSGLMAELVFGGGRDAAEFLFPSVKPEPIAFK